MSYEKPPYDATIDNIKLLCEELRDVSETDKDELEEGVEDLQGSTFSRTLEAAVRLGLFETLFCSTLLISESGFDGVFERFSSGFAVEFSSKLERSEILCEAIF
ncbi:hypothetical protein [Halorubrum tropicale]|uniref:hypothetical protein n=1 Tax=Halorubrum tropicale TaxID=1765655 RepID=UPI0014309219|nr:hypothetical protein [Halorubrum tropicale]